MNLRSNATQMKSKSIRSFRKIDHHQIVNTLVRIVLGQFDSQTSSLNSHRGVALGIEADWAPQYFSGDLILLDGKARMIEGVLRQVAKQSAERFRAAETMTICKLLYLLEALLPAKGESVREGHLTTG